MSAESGKIFHLSEDRLSELLEEPFSLEGDFQQLLARHPDLLPGDQIDPDSPRNWLLVSGEHAVSGPRELWALDHLPVDQDGIPNLVGVKRGSNPELHRRIISHMLADMTYAAQRVFRDGRGAASDPDA